MKVHVIEEKSYCVTVKVYVWATSKEDAIEQVAEDLADIIETDTGIVGFVHPEHAEEEQEELK